tara:strand:+ start:1444 stop:2223 length:780 start_codon:yes stop_codon:yes gene_type:complete
MVRTECFVVKTTGDVFHELQQFICGQVLQLSYPKLRMFYMTSGKFKQEFAEYFDYNYDEISTETLNKSKYLYNPKDQTEYLSELEIGNDYNYLVYEAVSEFRTPNCDLITYIKNKSKVHKKLINRVHIYVHPQLDMLYSDDKINVGLHYSMKEVSNVYSRCTVDEFNYIDFTNSGSMKKEGIEKYKISDQILLYIALSRCDMIMGDLDDIVNYEACMPKLSMLHDVAAKSLQYDGIVPLQIVYQETCLFPNSQILMQYL